MTGKRSRVFAAWQISIEAMNRKSGYLEAKG